MKDPKVKVEAAAEEGKKQDASPDGLAHQLHQFQQALLGDSKKNETAETKLKPDSAPPKQEEGASDSQELGVFETAGKVLEFQARLWEERVDEDIHIFELMDVPPEDMVYAYDGKYQAKRSSFTFGVIYCFHSAGLPAITIRKSGYQGAEGHLVAAIISNGINAASARIVSHKEFKITY